MAEITITLTGLTGTLDPGALIRPEHQPLIIWEQVEELGLFQRDSLRAQGLSTLYRYESKHMEVALAPSQSVTLHFIKQALPTSLDRHVEGKIVREAVKSNSGLADAIVGSNNHERTSTNATLETYGQQQEDRVHDWLDQLPFLRDPNLSPAKRVGHFHARQAIYRNQRRMMNDVSLVRNRVLIVVREPAKGSKSNPIDLTEED